MDNPDCVLIPPFAHEVFWRLVDFEEPHPDNELNHGNASHRNEEISPSHIILPRTFNGLSVDELLAARVLTNKGPCYQSPHDLRNRPKEGQDGK